MTSRDVSTRICRKPAVISENRELLRMLRLLLDSASVSAIPKSVWEVSSTDHDVSSSAIYKHRTGSDSDTINQSHDLKSSSGLARFLTLSAILNASIQNPITASAKKKFISSGRWMTRLWDWDLRRTGPSLALFLTSSCFSYRLKDPRRTYKKPDPPLRLGFRPNIDANQAR